MLTNAMPKAESDFSEECFFGSPSSPGSLKSLLAQAIERVPAGGEILWSTYYLANTELMERLALAAKRGVHVMVALEANPRKAQVNTEAFARLKGLKGVSLVPVRSLVFAHLHEKLYFFSHPKPFCFVGSYNPSMDAGLEPDDVLDIGDQDQGHNVLVRINSTAAVQHISQHLRAYAGQTPATSQDLDTNPVVTFLPSHAAAPHILQLSRDWQSIHIAMSHLRDGTVVQLLTRQARRGCKVRVISHESHRRFPARHERTLKAAGVEVWRYQHPQQFPMHSKYLLLRNGEELQCLYGSVNFTKTSRWLNREVLIQSSAARTYNSLLENWGDIRAEIDRDYH